MAAGELPLPPVMTLLGCRIAEVGDGTAAIELQVERRHHNAMGTLHGGVLCDIADVAMGFALASRLGANEAFTTIELKANYFKPIVEGPLRAVARTVRRTRALCMLECDVTDAGGSLVARISSTCMLLVTPNAG